MTVVRPAKLRPRRPIRARRAATGKLLRTLLLLVVTLLVLVPVMVTVALAFMPAADSAHGAAFTLDNFVYVFTQTLLARWVLNSLVAALGSVVVAIVVAAPAGYVLSRGRSKLVSGYALVLFVVQSLPVITAVIPLFILFSALGLTDSLLGLTIIYVAASVSVASWMMASYFNAIPISLEEAAWIDGCGILSSFVRIALRNSLPGVLSTAIFAFLIAWNDYLVAIVFLKTDSNFTLPMGLQSFFQQNTTQWGLVMAVSVVMMAPPVVVFATLNRYFSVGGIGGALAGR